MSINDLRIEIISWVTYQSNEKLLTRIKEAKDDFSVVVSYEDIKAKNYSLSAGQYFEVKIEYVDITHDEFTAKMNDFESNLTGLFEESKTLEKEIQERRLQRTAKTDSRPK